ncbi:uncharacterized protein LOC116344657 [Contarinia nasturtii]|uniref:uncharacterized protein LOC116344657 n=1 Tax=Contarinia nasturtii TaxID=265458 RepID=UPI0012D49D51|nr:uncharacterized protein LOC116344657 [Contarinia nasturtii]
MWSFNLMSKANMTEPPTKKVLREIDISPEEVPILSTAAENADFTAQESLDESIKIVHLSDDCLVRIFRYLSLIDLTNVAESNVRLARPAKFVFNQTHQNNQLFFKSRGEVIQIPEYHPMAESDHFTIDSTLVENIFKHFGKYMRRIKVFHALSSFRSTPNFNLMNPIAEHCLDTLQELEFFGSCVFNELRYRPKTFTRLEKVIFCEVIAKLSPVDNLNRMFPNLRFLEFHNVFHPFESFVMEQNFPRLEHFGIFTFPYSKFLPHFLPIINRFVNLNPQLRSLSMYDLKLTLNDLSMDTMLNIEKLEIGGRNEFPKPPFNFGNLTSLKLIFSNENKTDDIEWQHFSAQLEHLNIVGFQLNDKSVDLILQCTHLRSFSLTSFEGFDLKYIEKLAKNLRRLEEVEFISKFKEDSKQTYAFAGALIFMEKCATLRRATASIQVEKSDVKFRLVKWCYLKKDEFLDAYQEKLKKTLTFDWWRWPIKHEIKFVDYLKGWQGGPVFSVCMTNRNN